MEMFVQHVKGKFVRPGKLVLDLPVWFDTLVCQLLEKKTEHRPMDAAMVGNVLSTIEEKVQTLQSAGMSVATRKRGERQRNAPERSEADRELLRAMTGKGRRKTPKPQFYERWWFVTACALMLLAAMGTVGFVGVWMWPRSSSLDKLYASAKPLMESKNPDEDWYKAIDPDSNGPLYPVRALPRRREGRTRRSATAVGRDGAPARMRQNGAHSICKTRKTRSSSSSRQRRGAGERLRRRLGGGRRRSEPQLAEHWTKVKELAGKGGWYGLADEHPTTTRGPRSDGKQALDKHLDDLRRLEYKPTLDGPQLELAQALRYQRFDDDFRAYQEFETLRDKYSKDPEQRFWYLFAVRKARELKPKPGTSDDSTARKDRIAKRLQ